ncbi:nucleoside hydrolase [Paenibacillus validus]|uniref:Nucleoside hydrolase n=1 Tax=Paenibacillus validus TaxID=44253 RepID=A0A7X3CTF1_9BACL|nr:MULTISPECIES: nucleoside hydrolase [Paenibacillus]MED4602070.1 nucleoside hydrolase [Paenibacillus validus]MED4607364.1 nucleoside hydrolase [Paenibacillus validus]MUG72367.1 nucleoside hydrolase [Paenibacillus validus]
MQRIILDTDIGTDVDDALALALALRSPEIVLEGVTTVYGDVDIRARLVKKLMHLANRHDVCVYKGIEKPLLQNREVFWAGHEELLLSNHEAFDIEDRHAVDFIIDKIMSNPGEITLVPIGPLTNIAVAIIREPRIVEHVKEIILMGGVTRLGNNGIELPPIEHNVKCDPEAASLVFSSGAPIVMVGLDVTMKVRITSKEKDELYASGDPLNIALAQSIEKWLRFRGKDWTAMHDPLAVSLLVDRSIVQTQRMNIRVEYDHRHPTGQTVAVFSEDANVEIGLEVDNERFIRLLMDRLLAQN